MLDPSAGHSRPTGKPPFTGEERAAILEQMERILQSPGFKQSKRYPAVLRYLMDRALSGSTETDLKERTVGTDVLGRDPSYDTTADPSVRVVVGEVRKRLKLYFLQPGHESEIRIELPSWSYVPEFSFPAAGVAPSMARPRSKNILSVVVGVLIAAILLAVAWRQYYPPMAALDRFWEPVLQGSTSVTVCVSSSVGQNPSSDTPGSFGASRTDQERITMGVAMATSGVAALLGRKGVNHRLRTADATTLADLREGPVVLIGRRQNPWAMRITDAMRYRLKNVPGFGWIEDRENPSQQQWSVRYSLPAAEVTTDYALVTRTLDAYTGRMLVTLGGLSGLGTAAAGEFLVNPAYMEAVAAKAPKGWERKNIEIILQTKIVNGNAGPPIVVATYFW